MQATKCNLNLWSGVMSEWQRQPNGGSSNTTDELTRTHLDRVLPMQ